MVLRRKLTSEMLLAGRDENQGELAFIKCDVPTARYEYAVLVTSTENEILTLAQLYRDRADAENNFDQLKNQWGVGRLHRPRPRARLMARMVALVYDWWTLFVRLPQPRKHFEAISSRPLLLLYGVATQTQHAGQKRLTITSTHAKPAPIQAVLTNLTGFLLSLKTTAEQLTDAQRLRAILRRAFTKFMFATAGPRVLLPVQLNADSQSYCFF